MGGAAGDERLPPPSFRQGSGDHEAADADRRLANLTAAMIAAPHAIEKVTLGSGTMMNAVTLPDGTVPPLPKSVAVFGSVVTSTFVIVEYTSEMGL